MDCQLEYGGFDEYFLNQLPEEFVCPICILAIREPVQTECGHRFCLSCLEKTKDRNKRVFCPLDNNTINPNKIFPDKAVERVILNFTIKCHNFSRNCQWTGQLRAVKDHVENCAYENVECPNELCLTLIMRRDLPEHLEINCWYRKITCQYCIQKLIYKDLEVHLENCKYFPLECLNKCGSKRILRKKMTMHLADDCAHTVVPCDYLNAGCSFKAMRKEQVAHNNSSTSDHLSLAMTKLSTLENKVNDNEKEISSMKESIINFERTINSLQLKISEIENKRNSTERNRYY